MQAYIRIECIILSHFNIFIASKKHTLTFEAHNAMGHKKAVNMRNAAEKVNVKPKWCIVYDFQISPGPG